MSRTSKSTRHVFTLTGWQHACKAAAYLLASMSLTAAANTQTIHTVQLQLPTSDSPARFSALPVPAAQIDRAIERLDDIAMDVWQRSGIPGLALAVVRDGKTVYARGFGLRRVDAPLTVDAETVFQVASLSKPIGATVVATQVDAGLVTWDTPLTTLLPWFALSDPWVTRHVTIGDLYAHRSGLPDHAGDLLEDLGYRQREILERLALLKLNPFRTSYAYTNFGLTAAAQGVAAAADQDWASLSDEMLYRPLGMNATSSRHADFISRANRAYGHVPGKNGYMISDLRQPDAQSPAGGVSSNVSDLAKWMALILQNGQLDGKTIIDPQALLPALTPQALISQPSTPDARPSSYGYGFNVGIQPSGRVALSHSGAFSLGASTAMTMIPSLDIGIVVLTNAAPTGAAESIAAAFLDDVQFGGQTRDWFAAYQPLIASIMAPSGQWVGVQRPRDPVPALALAAYVGTYQNAYFGDVEIVERNGALAMIIGADRQTRPLTHWSGNDFTCLPYSENSTDGSISVVAFDAPEDKLIQSLRIEFLDELGMGRFVRLRP